MYFGPIVLVFGSVPQLLSKDRTKALDQSSGPRTGYLRQRRPGAAAHLALQLALTIRCTLTM